MEDLCELFAPTGFWPRGQNPRRHHFGPHVSFSLQIEISTYSMEFSLCIWNKSRFAKSGRAVYYRVMIVYACDRISGKVSGNDDVND